MKKEQQAKIEAAVTTILEAIGENPQRPGLVETPRRVAAMYAEVFAGVTAEPFADFKLFETTPSDEMVMVEKIPFHSMCEHHLLPFYGTVTIAYLPQDGKVLGLSKFPRFVEYCAKRPSVQEELTVKIAEELAQNIPVRGMAVAIEAEHMCMSMRGVKTPGSVTKTFHFTGDFQTAEWKQRFLWERR